MNYLFTVTVLLHVHNVYEKIKMYVSKYIKRFLNCVSDRNISCCGEGHWLEEGMNIKMTIIIQLSSFV
jgi:hypothetical protein